VTRKLSGVFCAFSLRRFSQWNETSAICIRISYVPPVPSVLCLRSSPTPSNPPPPVASLLRSSARALDAETGRTYAACEVRHTRLKNPSSSSPHFF
jgi:hypothetical protein